MNLKHLLTLFITASIVVTACKSTEEDDPKPEPPVVTVPTRAELTKDSIFLYAKQIYYWNSTLPSYEVFNPRKFKSLSTDLDNYEAELLAIAMAAVDPTTGRGYEMNAANTDTKYSYIFDKANKNAVAYVPAAQSSVDLDGNGNDLGIRFGFYGTTTNYVIYVTAVYQNSPAEKLGFKRGDVIKKINDISYGTNFNGENAAITTALNATTVKLQGLKSDGTSFEHNLVKSLFKSSPIYKSKVFTLGTKKVGYLAYARFGKMSNSGGVGANDAEFDAIFADFATQGVTDLIIDLRYNGGGYVNTATYLTNLIVPTAKANGTMFVEHYNATMQAGAANILANQPLLTGDGKVQYNNGKIISYADVDYSIERNTVNFSKKGNLANVQNAVFIVAGGTASASELVINNLKPHMNVKLVGQTTYGKPIGFFPITLENKYDVYFSLFETKNSAGQGGYYNGIIPDVVASEVPTGTIMYDFGDANDNYIKLALNQIAPGVIATGAAKTLSVKQKATIQGINTANVLNSDLINKDFIGMIETKYNLKK